MMSAKAERHSLLAALWFTVAHYCVRPWPWILVGLASVVLYPGLADKESGYVYLRLFTDVQFPSTLIYLVTWTTACWLIVTFLTPPESLVGLAGVWVGGWVLVYATLFGTGTLVLHSLRASLPCFATAAVSSAFVIWQLQRRGWRSVVE
jgi:hypothetical protein